MTELSRAAAPLSLPECGMYFGSGVYYSEKNYVSLSGAMFTTWIPQSLSPLEVLDRVIADNQGNLVQLWGFEGGAGRGGDLSPVIAAQYGALEDLGVTPPAPDWEAGCNLTCDDWPEARTYADRRGAGLPKFIKAAAERGLYTILIYTDAHPQWSHSLSGFGDAYLGYDFGERFAFRFESQFPESASLDVVAARFVGQVRAHIEERKSAGWGRVMATSASFHLDYEVAAGVDIPLAEDFAFSHLHMASSLSRGLYRQYQLPLWGSHMAHEHYSWLPYASEYKFPLLRTAFEQKYMAGCKVLIHECGNWSLQGRLCEDSPMNRLPGVELGNIQDRDPRKIAPFAKEAEKHYGLIDYGSPVARQYRKVLSDFYDFLKAEGTPRGQPEVTLAIAKGNYDLCGHEFHPNFPIAGMFETAEREPRWFEGAPEKGWDIVKSTFYPRPEVLAPHANRFLAGTPHGMIDIVSFALDRIDAAFLSRHYKALLFAGWNTSSPYQYEVLEAYVRAGGTLFLAIPHLSMNRHRNFTLYSRDDLVHGGDFTSLCGVRITGRGSRFYWATPVDNGGVPGYRRRFGIMATCLGEMEIVDPAVETLFVDDEKLRPVLVRRRLGEGTVYFLNSWAYPGALEQDIGPGSRLGSKGLIATIYADIAKSVRGTVWITSDGETPGPECDFISWSRFPECGTICLQNIDYKRPHAFRLHHDGAAREVELGPGEFRLIRPSA